MNTKNANKYLDGYQINDRSVFDNKDIEHPLDCLLEDYHQEQLKLLNISVVNRQREQLICSRCNQNEKQEINDPYCIDCKIEIESR